MNKLKYFLLKIEFLSILMASIFLLSCRSAKSSDASDTKVMKDKDTKKIIVDHSSDKINGNLLIHFDSVEDFMNYDPSKDTAREPSPTDKFIPLSKKEKEELKKVWIEDRNSQDIPPMPTFLHSSVEEEK